jgi:MurNAc alpha-1-phosphate uridylyltransferase
MMKAMILAAGRGERMRPLTDHIPKPLLPVAGKPLIIYHLESLRAAGITELVINTSYLGELLPAALGDGRRWGVQIVYSPEPQDALGTGGGILKALPILEPEPFLVINSDIWTDYKFEHMPSLIQHSLAHLVLVSNPPHHPQGDFSLEDKYFVGTGLGLERLTFSGISMLRPELFTGCSPGSFPLGQLIIDRMISKGVVTGEHYKGKWFDIGTPQRLAAIDLELQANSSTLVNV